MGVPQAKKLRSNMTDAERRLWYRLRAHRFEGIKFKRQVPIGPYVVDFACLSRKLILESTAVSTLRTKRIAFASNGCKRKDLRCCAFGITMS